MGSTTSIGWTERTWNFIVGCTAVSAGCDNCYARSLVNRWHIAGQKGGKQAEAFPEPFDVVVTRPDRFMMLPFTPEWRQPSMVFVNSLSDLFHRDVEAETIARAFAVMSLADQHIYQFLTKRAGVMCSVLNDRRFVSMVDSQRHAIRPGCGDFEWPLPNVWGGVSVEHQDTAYRIDKLLATPLAVRWVSGEPLLSRVDLTPYLPWWKVCAACNGILALENLRPDLQERHLSHPEKTTPGIDWVVVGGESGSGARPMNIEWAGAIAEQCAAAGVPYFFKQTGSVLARQLGLPGKGDKAELWPTHISPEVWRQEYPERPAA